MSQFEKLKKKIYEKPVRNDMTFDEIKTLVEAYGCLISGKGKHVKIVYRPLGYVIPIPCHGKCVGEAYVKQVRDLIDQIENSKEA